MFDAKKQAPHLRMEHNPTVVFRPTVSLHHREEAALPPTLGPVSELQMHSNPPPGLERRDSTGH